MFIDYEDYGYMKCALDDAIFREFCVSSIVDIELATGFEIKNFYDKIIAQYESEETDLYKYFTDSVYYELKDWLIHKCQLFVDYNFKYPSFIDNFAHYAWDILCKKSDELGAVTEFTELTQQSNNQASTTKMVSLDKVEEFLESCLFNAVIIEDGKEVPDEIIVIKYRSVAELIEGLHKAMEA